MKRIYMTHFLDQFRNYNIHEMNYQELPERVRKHLDKYEGIEFYTAGLKNGKKFNKVKEFKRLIKVQQRVIKSHKGEESNTEGIVIDQLIELLRRMPAKDVRALQLEKLL